MVNLKQIKQQKLGNMRYIVPLIALPMVSFLGLSSALAQDDSWAISEEQAACIVEHATEYMNAGSPVIIIHVASCPNPSPFAGAGTGKSNYGGVGRIESTSDSSILDEIITFTAHDFECLTVDQVRIEDRIAYLPKRDICGR